MNLVIDKAIPEDALAIQEIFHKTWLDTYVSPEHGVTVEHISDYFKDAYKPETLEKRKNQISKMDGSTLSLSLELIEKSSASHVQ